MGHRWLRGLSVLAFWGAPSIAAGDPGAVATDVKQQCVSAADDGQQLRDAGKYSAARAQFERCASVTCPLVVSQQCTIWLKDLGDSTPSVVPAATDADGHDVAEAQVFVDGTLIGRKLDGKPIELDPGRHVLKFQDAAQNAATVEVVLRAGERNRVVRATLASAKKRALPPNESMSPQRASQQARLISSGSLLGVGVVASGVGILFASAARNEANQARNLRQGMGNSACFQSSSSACASLANAVNAQGRDATASSVLYVAGGLTLAAAAVTWLVWPTGTKDAASVASFTVLPRVESGYAGLAASALLP